jgi:hypothetical protein
VGRWTTIYRNNPCEPSGVGVVPCLQKDHHIIQIHDLETAVPDYAAWGEHIEQINGVIKLDALGFLTAQFLRAGILTGIYIDKIQEKYPKESCEPLMFNKVYSRPINNQEIQT